MKTIDRATGVRAGEELNHTRLLEFLQQNIQPPPRDISIQQFPGGFSNLTYRVVSDHKEWVLRRPPLGVVSSSAHNMQREYALLNWLHPIYSKCPQPLVLCDDPSVLGAPFYLMDRIKGVILRNINTVDVGSLESIMRPLSIALIDQLAYLHNLDISSTKLLDLDRSEGYTKRQVMGWIKRYERAKTKDIEAMQVLANWLPTAVPATVYRAIIHNDYKYDNLILDPHDLTQIKAVLDWEMATIGDPLCDLGTTLAYWVEAGEEPQLRPFNLSWIKGNLSRQELIQRYMEVSRLDLSKVDFLFYYVLGLFKVAVIAQQIYARYAQGTTKDKRFASMIYLVEIAAQKAVAALEAGKI